MAFPWLKELLGILEVQDDGEAMPTRSFLNFIGDFEHEDDPENDTTNITVQPTVNVHDLTHAPIGLWQLNETLNDTSGNNRHLVMSAGNTRYTEIYPGVRALNLATTNRLNFSTTGTALQRTGDITIEMLLLLYAYPAGLAPLVSYQASGETEATNTLYETGLNVDQLRWLSESGAGVDATFSVDRLPALGEICHFATRRSSNVIQNFVNGSLLGSASGTLTTPTGGTSSSFWVGSVSGFTPACAMASLKVVASALTNDEIKAEYNRTLGGLLGRLP